MAIPGKDKAFRLLNQFGESAMQTAKNIAQKSGMADFSVSTLKQSEQELADMARQTLIKNNTISKAVSQQSIKDAATATQISSSAFNAQVNKFASAIQQNNVDEARTVAGRISSEFGRDEFMSLLSKGGDTMALKNSIISQGSNERVKGAFQQTVSSTKLVKNPIVSNLGGEGFVQEAAYKANGLKGYFSTPDKEVNRMRAGVVAGGYLAGANAVRLVKGGNPVTNEYGERDIAGIPFI